MQPLNLSFNMGLTAKLLALKGDMVYEYNPFKTFRVMEGNEELSANEPNGILQDLDTVKLTFDLKHPTEMTVQPSYDGSVNIIINDGINLPRMINSRFSVTGNDTYLIVDREGDNDTNIYNRETFDTDTSLYKKVTSLTKIKFMGLSTGGNLPVGNYHFYFKLADADGNETDFVGESGLVTCYIGNLNDPYSIQGGLRNLNSFKSVHFKLSNIDASYSNVVVYYTRYTSDNLANKTTEAFKILKLYPVYSRNCEVKINGYEETLEESINDINTLYNLIESANTLDIAQNMLFLGNVNKIEIPYKELADLSLRFFPQVIQNENIGNVNERYKDPTGKYEYYNVNNIYHKLGYWDDEIYRFGVVYIMKDFSLSPVFNIMGRSLIDNNTIINDNGEFNVFIENSLAGTNSKIRKYIPIDKLSFRTGAYTNSKGVGRIKANSSQITDNGVYPIGIKIASIDTVNLFEELKKYTIGCFFVRQKRIATTLCQAVSIGIESTSHLPTLPVSEDRYLMERFINDNRLLVHDFDSRKVLIKDTVNDGLAAICPEYELNPAFFNLFFTGGIFTIVPTKYQFKNQYCTRNSLHLYNLSYIDNNVRTSLDFRIVSLLDSQALAKNKNVVYSAMAGTAEEAFRVSYYSYKSPHKEAVNLLRGAYGPYLGLEGIEGLPNKMTIFDIKIPNYSEGNYDEYFQIRYLDTSPFYPISDRMEWNEVKDSNIYYRGDCFIGNFTHRMVRNFADPTAPYNDEIINQTNWAEEMDLNDSDTYAKVNRGDVNAIKMGHWFTTKVCSNINISLRSVDHSWAAEEGITNKPRAFFPLYAMNTSGENKVPESQVYNDGYTVTLSSKYNYEVPNVPAIKNVFVTRIMYSNVAIDDSFRNSFRVFDMMHYRDYTLTYGELVRLVELKGSLIAVFEHGVCLIPINERAIAGRGAGGNIFINTSNVLPDNPLVLNDMYGSKWPESVIKTPYYIYGIDTVGKKIWRTNGQNFEIISDFRVEKFLINNITLTEAEKEPIIGIRNVKSHYNAFKGDVMFTFYDDINTIEEKVWNLCYNEILQQFTTLYSWIPSYSANIDNIFFSFDRNTSKIITKLTSIYPKIALDREDTVGGALGKLFINGNSGYSYKFTAYDDNSNNALRYTVENNYLYVNLAAYNSMDYWTAAVKAEIVASNNTNLEEKVTYVGGTLYGTVSACKDSYKDTLTTSFWKHGQGGLMQTEKIKPCFWYGKLHPFEFEFVVLDNPLVHKIFNNLQIISNKALPESFHFLIVGEVYDWSWDKLNMYCRLEATKLLFLRLGSNIKYNPNYLELEPKLQKILGSIHNKKSTYLPLYYNRIGTLDEIYNSYTRMQQSKGSYSNNTPPRDYSHLSGSEITYDPLLNEFGIFTHIACCPIDSYYDKEISQEDYEYILDHFDPSRRKVFAWYDNNDEVKYYERFFYGRIKGNSEYKEDKWYVLIPSITFMLKNEDNWPSTSITEDGVTKTYIKPPLIINPSELPKDILSTQITETTLPTGYKFTDLQILPNTGDRGDAYPSTYGGWTGRKETKIRDKYIRIRIRYTGNDLAVISAIKTIYTESYA